MSCKWLSDRNGYETTTLRNGLWIGSALLAWSETSARANQELGTRMAPLCFGGRKSENKGQPFMELLRLTAL